MATQIMNLEGDGSHQRSLALLHAEFLLDQEESAAV